MRLFTRPYNLFLMTAILLFLVGLFYIDSAVNVHLHDTYYVFPLAYVFWTLSIFLFFFWLLYLGTRRVLFSKKLSWLHIVLTIVSCILVLAIPNFLRNSYEGLAGMPRRYYDIGQAKTYAFFGNATKAAIYLFLVVAIAQLAFFINFFIGLYKKLNGQNNR